MSGAEDKAVTIEMIVKLTKNDGRWLTIFDCFSLPLSVRGGYMDTLPDPNVTPYSAIPGFFTFNNKALTGPVGLQIYPDATAPLAGCGDVTGLTGLTGQYRLAENTLYHIVIQIHSAGSFSPASGSVSVYINGVLTLSVYGGSCLRAGNFVDRNCFFLRSGWHQDGYGAGWLFLFRVRHSEMSPADIMRASKAAHETPINTSPDMSHRACFCAYDGAPDACVLSSAEDCRKGNACGAPFNRGGWRSDLTSCPGTPVIRRYTEMGTGDIVITEFASGRTWGQQKRSFVEFFVPLPAGDEYHAVCMDGVRFQLYLATPQPFVPGGSLDVVAAGAYFIAGDATQAPSLWLDFVINGLLFTGQTPHTLLSDATGVIDYVYYNAKDFAGLAVCGNLLPTTPLNAAQRSALAQMNDAAVSWSQPLWSPGTINYACV